MRKMESDKDIKGSSHQIDNKNITLGSNPKNQLDLLGLTMLGLGGAIGSGIFVASGIAINQAGPSIILAFAVGGLVSALIMFMLAEMSVYEPTCGSFSVYAGEYLGPAMGFITGWMYWIAGILTLATEMVAAALIVRYWLPSWPIWLISLIIAMVIVGISFLDIRAFARVEETLSFVKVAILLLVICSGIVMFTGIWPGLRSPGTINYLGHGGFFPHGWRGFLASLLLVLYTYAGEQVIGPATGETKDPLKTVPRAVSIITITLIVIYLGAITTLVGIVPWNQVPQNGSGFVPLAKDLGLSGISSIMNAVILSAILSAMNSNMYGVPRMLKSLAERKDAPSFLTGENRQGVPVAALLISSAILLVVVGISYLLPEKIFVYIASTAGAALILNWLIIALTYYRFRQRANLRPGKGQPTYPGFPGTTIAASLLLSLALATSAFNGSQLVGLVAGVLILMFFSGLYIIFVKKH
ncbi:gamma-aminobutyrate permease-like transporter [Desulfosporosinus acidiphilus SJ4]|uniref:Gamma-aminobutyrate permease-like transporter n=1 Tax=Desulfosporosinus acidiphilus (strain DSM 22704 / JCM 16185 / SJ4) TaxID=646529 RepID=I4D4G0_DESAJ|nr:amino acid permease [Desulfosporosinus acidiphilus]AFM40684.1 gamma-aminobutyrate permease-like transporter [Desulfosporosinus acidiphilus SJ4]